MACVVGGGGEGRSVGRQIKNSDGDGAPAGSVEAAEGATGAAEGAADAAGGAAATGSAAATAGRGTVV